MSTQTFLLTYTVLPTHEQYTAEANKLRNHIATDLEGFEGTWRKLENKIETAFTGKLDLWGYDESKNAKNDVTKTFKKVFVDHDISSYDVKVSIALLVNTLDDVIEFTV